MHLASRELIQHGLSLLNLGPSNLGTVAAYLGLYVCWDAFSFLLLRAGKAGRDASCSVPGRALGGLQDRYNLHVRGPAHLPLTCPFSTFGAAPTKPQGSSEPHPTPPSPPPLLGPGSWHCGNVFGIW